MTEGEFVVLGDTICRVVQSPVNACRWIERNGERVLQQAWTATTTDRNGYVHQQIQWQDVPLVVGEKEPTKEG